jgi:hypothetical protein
MESTNIGPPELSLLTITALRAGPQALWAFHGPDRLFLRACISLFVGSTGKTSLRRRLRRQKRMGNIEYPPPRSLACSSSFETLFIASPTCWILFPLRAYLRESHECWSGSAWRGRHLVLFFLGLLHLLPIREHLLAHYGAKS